MRLRICAIGFGHIDLLCLPEMTYVLLRLCREANPSLGIRLMICSDCPSYQPTRRCGSLEVLRRSDFALARVTLNLLPLRLRMIEARLASISWTMNRVIGINHVLIFARSRSRGCGRFHHSGGDRDPNCRVSPLSNQFS